ncbi:MAG TPA: flagellar motor switch protein FliN [Bryobacteraceae bacterium]|nr:flagellar motor switch protein FliN [Bryobacteraceae bacterium]
MSAEARSVVNAWAEEVKAVLQFLTAEEWTSAVVDPDSEGATKGFFWWMQKFNLASDAEVYVGAPALAWSELGARVLQAAGVELIEQASAKNTYLESLQQSMSGLTRALTEIAGRPVEATGGREQSPSHPGVTFEVVLSAGGFDLPALRVVISNALCSALGVRPASAATKVASSAIVATPPPTPATGALVAGPQPAATPSGVAVLLDVQMPVSICFGRASMPLREVLKLTSGSAVELDRRPDDEVDIIVNDCVIAKGEVVVIDGNYGVRVTGIVSREQRLALRSGGR